MVRITPSLDPATRKTQPHGSSIKSPITLDRGPAWKSHRDGPWSVEVQPREERPFSPYLAKGLAPACELSLNINILKIAWVRYLKEAHPFFLSTHTQKRHYLLFFWKRHLGNNSPSPTSLLPAKFQWIMGAILWNFETWGTGGEQVGKHGGQERGRRGCCSSAGDIRTCQGWWMIHWGNDDKHLSLSIYVHFT